MSGSDPDKTRINFPPRSRVGDEERGLHSPTDANVAMSTDDKTRIADKTKGKAGAETGRREESTNENRRDATRYVAKPIVPDEKTRIRPPGAHPSAITDRRPPIAGETDAASHEVLKGRFVLEKVLGAGGMGVVYKAKDLLKVEAQDRDPYVAIKVLSDEFKSHPEAFISLQRESRKSQRIAHPNIVNVHDFDRDGDTVFMTMEYMEGTPLDKLIEQYKATGLPTDDAWTIIDGMSHALSHAHAENIVHSDFKPGNVFVTNKGVAKVFDFGISRAVAIAERGDNKAGDKTLFDAATLGALTPAYASLEMLQGEAPDVRDDIFALGCVAYEMLTGRHPYNRVPADEAEKQGLKPKRIPGIKKQQWNAIEKATALRREARTGTVEEFIDNLSPKGGQRYRIATALVVVMSLGVAGYLALFQQDTVDPLKEFNLRNELELKVKIDFYKDHLGSLLQSPRFDENWRSAVWKDVSDLMKLTRNKDPWVFEKKSQIYQMYLSKFDDAINGVELGKARRLLEAARNYTDDTAELDQKADVLAKAFAQAEALKAGQAQMRSERRVSTGQNAKTEQPKRREKTDLFKMALSNVNLQLKCQGRLNMSDLEAAVRKLREVDFRRYQRLKARIVAALGECIEQIGKAFPDRASEAKKHSLRIFRGNAYLANIEIRPRDVCDVSLAGLGGRGNRAICKDKLGGNKLGPDLVVIPGKGNMPPFAIGKYEISTDEINLFCKATRECRPMVDRDGSLPAANMSFHLAEKYLKWLSKLSSRKYRLPTRSEWVYAAKGRQKRVDANRNCRLSARGIEKGDGPVRSDIGAPNDWGLVNHVGNVREWVYDKGRKLVAVGGSFGERMDNCDVATTSSHAGTADIYTGFRVLREIRRTP